MSFEEKICLSMLERLKRLQETQQIFSARSHIYMQNIGSQTPPSLVTSNLDDTENALLPLNSNTATCNINRQISNNLFLAEAEVPDAESCPKGSELYARYAEKNCNESFSQNEENSIQDENEKSGAKFPFLKKGQGIARFKVRPIKGFRKKPSLVQNLPKSKLQLKNPVKRNALLPIDSNAQACSASKKSNAFEKLEELVERDSFCSKSSQVIELLHEDPSFCSTPISSKTTFEQSLTLTPIRKEKCRKQILEAMSPGRNQPPLNMEAQSLLIKQVQNMKLLEIEGNAESRTFAAKSLSQVKNWSGSGILKKNTPDTCTATSPSVSKVKFLNEGVKVLEYDDSETETNISTACSDASDLLSSSDLKNLMLFNYKFNVVHESSFVDDTTSKLPVHNDGYALEIDQPNRRESFQSAFRENHPVVSVQSAEQVPIVKPTAKKHLQSKTDSVVPLKNNSCEDKNNLDLNTHKNLLLSKVDDLTKEIDIFKKRNKGMETLMVELETEKKILLEKQKQSQLEKKASSLACTTKIRKKEREEKLSQSQNSNGSIVSSKLEELNERLNKLNAENNNLKRKVITLERKERELRKSNEEKDKENKANRGKMQCINYRLKEKPKTVPANTGSCSVLPKKSAEAKQMKGTGMPSAGVSKTKNVSSRPNSGELENENKKVERLSQDSKDEFAQIEPEKLVVTSSNCNSSNDIAMSDSNIRKMQNPHNLFTIQETDEDVTKCDTDYSSPNSINPANTLFDDHYSKRKYVEKYDNSSQKTMKMNAGNVEIIDIPASLTKSVSNGSPTARVVTFENGDQKTICENKETYHYAKDNVVHTIHKDDGREEIEFANGQREIYFKDGSYQIIFPDSSSKSVYKDGSEVCVWKDGTVIKISEAGIKSVHFPNGQREVHEENAVRRIYPDGTVKILYRDGKQETRYSNGRVRIKDKDGNIFVKKK